MRTPGLGDSQRSILEVLKRRGRTTIPELSAVLGLNVETVRAHVRALAGHDLVRRDGSVRSGPGRPEIVYVLTPGAEDLFPRREGQVLRDLAEYLLETGNEAALGDFFERFIGGRRAEALARVDGLAGRERVGEVALILSELGFMAEVEMAGGGPRLRLCHCPLRDLVEATKLPCRAEIGFVKELLGEDLTRESYIPAGDASCSYETGTGR